MPVDYHLHTRRCGHAEGDLAAYLAAASAAGLREVGFADHIPLYFLPRAARDRSLAMGEEELPLYVAEVEALRAAHPGPSVRLGIEADYLPGYEKELARILVAYPFDYVIGSIHYLDGWGFDNPEQVAGYEGRDPDELYRAYFALLERAAASGLFDIIAHPDLIKKFGCRPAADPGPLYERAAAAFARAGVCVEVNTAGLRAPAGEIYPAPRFLYACRRHGVPATIGSDAHHPGQVGAGLEVAVTLLKEAGYRQVATFHRRRRSFLSL
ncbi:MAG: histidinol-phosphatase HisJ family protein [Bacillota bacterium]